MKNLETFRLTFLLVLIIKSLFYQQISQLYLESPEGSFQLNLIAAAHLNLNTSPSKSLKITIMRVSSAKLNQDNLSTCSQSPAIMPLDNGSSFALRAHRVIFHNRSLNARMF
jgi:hypothetical protein